MPLDQNDRDFIASVLRTTNSVLREDIDEDRRKTKDELKADITKIHKRLDSIESEFKKHNNSSKEEVKKHEDRYHKDRVL